MNLKSPKVKKLIDENGIEIDNFTMVIRLKKIISQLNNKIKQQNQTIMSLKRDTKTTKINQMQVEIQHLNDQNKRLTLLIQQIKNKYKKEITNYSKLISNGNSPNSTLMKNSSSDCQQFIRNLQSSKNKKSKKRSQIKKDSTNNVLFTGSIFNFSSNVLNNGHKKSYPQTQKEKQQFLKQQQKQKKFEKKYYQLLEQTQKLKKQLITIKINESTSISKKNKSMSPQQRNSLILQKNMQCIERISQKKHDLQAQNEVLKRKLVENQKRTKQLQNQNQRINKCFEDLKTEVKCKSLLNSEKALTNSKSIVFRDISNSEQNNINSPAKSISQPFERSQNNSQTG